MKFSITLNRAGIAAIAKGPEMQALVAKVAAEIADQVRGQGIKVGDRDGGGREVELPVEVSTKITDRARARVAITHPAGTAVQAKHGALTRAASASGVKVRGG